MSLTHFRCCQIYYTVLLHNVTYIIPLSYKFVLNFVLSVDRLKECVINAFQMLSDLLHSTFTQCYVYYTVKLQVCTELCFKC